MDAWLKACFVEMSVVWLVMYGDDGGEGKGGKPFELDWSAVVPREGTYV